MNIVYSASCFAQTNKISEKRVVYKFSIMENLYNYHPMFCLLGRNTCTLALSLSRTHKREKQRTVCLIFVGVQISLNDHILILNLYVQLSLSQTYPVFMMVIALDSGSDVRGFNFHHRRSFFFCARCIFFKSQYLWYFLHPNIS